MHQAKKGNQWYFGMKARIGVDAESGLVHAVAVTAAHVSDVSQAHKLLHGEQTQVLGDAGYQGVDKRDENRDTKVTWHVAMKRGKRKALPTDRLGKLLEKLERCKASIRAKVEHPFHVLKNLFKHKKTRYRGLAKNEAQISVYGQESNPTTWRLAAMNMAIRGIDFNFGNGPADVLTGSTGFAALRPKASHWLEFVYLVATSETNIERLAHLADGGAYPAVRPEIVVQEGVVVPTQSVAQAFNQHVQPLFAKILANRESAKFLAELRDTLLPKLLSGELRIADTENLMKRAEALTT